MGRRLSPPARGGNELRFVDLFAGAGGISEGFRQAGLRPILGSDVDPDACATYAANFPEAAAVCGDVRADEVRSRILELGRGADIVAGGPPCQAFSQVRNHARIIEDPRNSLYREFVGVVESLEPRAFVMENVPGMAQLGVVGQVVDDLNCAGRYDVSPTLVDAADFGVPQTRKRIVFIGIHRDLRIDPPMLEGTAATAGLSLARRRGSRRYRVAARASHEELAQRLGDPWDDGVVSVDQAIGDLAFLTAGHRAATVDVARLPQPASAYQKAIRDDVSPTVTAVGVPRINHDTVLRLRSIPPGGNHLDLPEELRGRYLTGARWGQDNGSGRLSRKHFYAYRRLHPDMWSWTLNTKADSVYHWAAERALSVREFARIQSFPDRFVIVTDPRTGVLPGRIDGGAGHSRYRQIGNAVPPLLARALAGALRQALLPGG
ncbi:MAG: DNA cytosine methyltransferase [Acidimicrobiales bacterium]